MAFATRYAVSTHVASSTLEDKLPAMCGSATLATLVSSTSMKVASITVPAITQGLITGRAGVRNSTISVCKTAGIMLLRERKLLREYGGFDIHSRTQHLVAARNGIE